MNSDVKSKIRMDVAPSVPSPEGEDIVYDDTTPEQEEEFVRELLERNAEVLRGLARR